MKAFEENAFAKKVGLRKHRTKSKETIKNHELHSEFNREIRISFKKQSKMIGFTHYKKLNS